MFSRMGTYICNINVKHSQLACDLVSLMNVIGILRQFVHLNQLIVLGFDAKQKPHTLNIQILLLRQKCMQLIIYIKITLH